VPSDILFLFAHGAGAPSSHPWMQAWSQRLGTLGRVIPFDYPYIAAGRRTPDPLPKLLEAHRLALKQARESHSGPVVLIGKSMGGRIGCHLSLNEEVSAVICLGYPLCAQGDRTKLRDQVLRELSTPILFVQGTRDSLCPLDLLEPLRSQMRTRNELDVVEGGDHSLVVLKGLLKTRGKTQEKVDADILQAIDSFVRSVVSPDR